MNEKQKYFLKNIFKAAGIPEWQKRERTQNV